MVASRLNAHRTDSFGVNVSAAVSFALINNNPNTKILDVDKEAVMATASPMPAAVLANVVSCFGKNCQPGTGAVGSGVYMMIPLRDVNDNVVVPVPSSGVRNVTAPNIRANGQDAYSLGHDAYSLGHDAFSLGQDAFTAGSTVRHQPGYVEKRKCIPCTDCGWHHNQHHKTKAE